MPLMGCLVMGSEDEIGVVTEGARWMNWLDCWIVVEIAQLRLPLVDADWPPVIGAGVLVTLNSVATTSDSLENASGFGAIDSADG